MSATEIEKKEMSAFRIRLGVFFLFLWWIPVWALVPALSEILGLDSSQSHRLLIGVILLQTVIGFAGLFIAGKQIAGIMKKTPFKKTPGIVWHALISGKIPE